MSIYGSEREDDMQYHQLLNVQSDSGVSDGEGGPRSLKTLVPRTRAVYTPKKRAEKDTTRAPRKECVHATTARRPVVCTCTAEYYDMQRLFQHYTHLAMRPTVFDDVVHIKFGARHTISNGESSTDAETSGKKFDVFFFSYGVFVCWGVGENEVAAIRREVAGFESKVLDEEEFEEFDYAHSDKFYIDRLKDEIVLNSDLTEEEDVIAKCAISHGLALGVKLAVFEEAIEKTIQGTKHLPEDLSLDGTINMSSKDISRIIGELFIQRNCVNLHSDILGVPDFFWENSELEPLYAMTRSYLDLNKRVEILNKRLDVLKELLEILQDQLNTQHASRLEWFVIWLILMELAITCLWDILIKDLNAFGLCGTIRCGRDY